MNVYEQGEDYVEDDFEEDVESEAEEDTESKITSIYGIPIKTAIIGAAFVLVLILALVIFSTRRKSQKAEELNEMLNSQPVQEEVQPVEPVTDTTVTDTPVADTSGASSGEAVFNPETGLWETPTSTDAPVVAETATDEERLKLRAMGYSGDEIDVALSEGFSVDALVADAQALYDEEADKALKRMSDSASEEFRYIIDNSYFSQVGYEFVSLQDEQFGTYEYSKGSYTVNADYVKCPTYGSQLQLKCRVAQDLWVFYIVTPERFAQLPQEGNIVLRVDFTVYGVNTYVTNVTETDPTLDTIDSSEITADEIDGTADDTADVSEPVQEDSTAEDANADDQ